MVLAHYQVIIVNVTLLSDNSKVLPAQRRFTAHITFSAIEILSAEINGPEMRLNGCNLYHFFVVRFFRFGSRKGDRVQATLSDITCVTNDHPVCSSSIYCKFCTY